MTKTYTVMRLVSGRAGGVAVPQGTFSTEEAARDHQKAKQLEFKAMMELVLMQVTSPSECDPVMKVQEFLQVLGIENVQFFIYESEVHESALLALPNEKKIILAS